MSNKALSKTEHKAMGRQIDLLITNKEFPNERDEARLLSFLYKQRDDYGNPLTGPELREVFKISKSKINARNYDKFEQMADLINLLVIGQKRETA